MFTKKNLEENALLEVLDEELAQFSGGGILDGVPVVGPLVGPVVGPVGDLLNGTQIKTGLEVTTPIADVGLRAKTNPGLGSILGS